MQFIYLNTFAGTQNSYGDYPVSSYPDPHSYNRPRESHRLQFSDDVGYEEDRSYPTRYGAAHLTQNLMYDNHQGQGGQTESMAMTDYGHYGQYQEEPEWQNQRHDEQLSMQVFFLHCVKAIKCIRGPFFSVCLCVRGLAL